jgi:molybdate transport system substrate-binding protein
MFQHVVTRIGVCALILAAAGCDRSPREAERPDPARTDGDLRTSSNPLCIAAASDLQRVLPRLVERFQSKTRISTTFSLDASGRLAEQIRAGAPFDVFLAANTRFVNELAEEELILSETARPYARGALVLCVHDSVAMDVSSLGGLTSPRIQKVAIANPEYAPYGTAAKQALERSGLWSSLEPKIVRADSVRQALAYAQNGDAEAALVSQALADVPEVRTIEIDESLYDPLIQSLGVISATTQRDRALEFVRFTVGEEGQTILREAGFQSASANTRTGERGLGEEAWPKTPRE